MLRASPAAQEAELNKDGGAWTGFLVMAFVVVGLVGAMATFAAQIPFERALARNDALNQALAVAGEPDAAARLEALRPALDDSADRIMKGPGDMASRVAAERQRMLKAFGEDARDAGFRLRFVLAVFTAAAALAGFIILGIARRQPR
jgi:hypothetical protein